MIFSPTSQHALRAMIHLALRYEGGPTLGRAIADEEGVPRQFLSKILHTLRNAGLVKSTMGPGGGYELSMSPDKITVEQVVEAIEGPLSLDERCILGLDECSDENHCALHDQWKKFRFQFINSIHKTSLSEASRVLRKKRRASGVL
ncbi:MAG TPA: Rrf2 family transcriptional regulator [candidate division Zixibacteria bacterium]|nr:Rrf2 family transcriptional regulator [candidate division Zixibacteria bacterium]